MNSLLPHSRGGTGMSHWHTSPDLSSRWDTVQPCSLRLWRTPRTCIPHQYTGLCLSSLRGIVALNSCRLQSPDHTHTPLRCTPPDQSSHLGNEALSSFCRPSLPHRCSHTDQSWSSHGCCNLGQSPHDLKQKVDMVCFTKWFQLIPSPTRKHYMLNKMC